MHYWAVTTQSVQVPSRPSCVRIAVFCADKNGVMNLTLHTPLSSVLTNSRRVHALKALGVVSVGDALTYYPFRVADPVPMLALRQAVAGNRMAFAAEVRDVRAIPMNARRGYRVQVAVDDAGYAQRRQSAPSTAILVFFSYKKHYIDWLLSRMRIGTRLVVSGEPSLFNGRLQFTHPDVLTVAHHDDAATQDAERSVFDVDTEEEGLRRVTRPRPVYHASSRISSDIIHETILDLLARLADSESMDERDAPGADAADTSADAGDAQNMSAGSSGESEIMAMVMDDNTHPAATQLDSGRAWPQTSTAVPDILPEIVRTTAKLMHRYDAFWAIHDPQSVEQFKRGLHTLRYEEAFISQVAVVQMRQQDRQSRSYVCSSRVLLEEFIADLPFALTHGQREVIEDIVSDMGREYPMQRLLQGEVGSGKTVVALAAILQAVGSGYQAVLVAPTQVLAEQHMGTISRMVAGLSETEDGESVPVILLTGGMKLAARRKALAQVASGVPCIVVATHAAFSKSFQAPNLALTVIDEQHRFGVEQRSALRSQGERLPHTLVMTATPIPRSAAMTWFGNLDISWLTELPGGRKPIRTVVVHEEDSSTMVRMFSHIRKRIDAGERVYVVCPRIDEDDEGGDIASDGMSTPIGEEDDAQTRPEPHSVVGIRDRLEGLAQFQGVSFATLTGRDSDEDKQRIMADFSTGVTPILVATTVIEVGVDVPQASCIVIFDADRFGLAQLHQLRGRVGRGGTASWAFLISRIAQPGSLAEQRLDVVQGTLDGAEIAQADLQLRGAGDVLGDAQAGVKSSLKLLRVVQDADMIVGAREFAEKLLDSHPEVLQEPELAGAVLDLMRGGESQLVSG